MSEMEAIGLRDLQGSRRESKMSGWFPDSGSGNRIGGNDIHDARNCGKGLPEGRMNTMAMAVLSRSSCGISK